jgi:hypothetical protein
MSPAAINEPDCIKVVRNSPSVFPPFDSICKATEMAPTLCPHLKGRHDIQQHPKPVAESKITLHGNFHRVSPEVADVILDPVQRSAF